MGRLGQWRHLCVDMQRLFGEETPWGLAWFDRVLPQIEEMTGRHAERTIFTRFMPPRTPEDMPGQWRDYYRKWWMMTGEHLPAEMTEVVAALARFMPPARSFLKPCYSPWFDGRLHATLQAEAVETLVMTGGETDVCVLATVLGAIDHGYRVIVLTDGVCSSADATHDASIKLLGARFSTQVELATTADFLDSEKQ
ncbi:cysteine hydrolase [Rhizobium sp. YJ-22]|uniref:cysteine hydrolase family protein n=1 Tax=Rhizobium sp. YJ-22 TaxID=3037556 RepID=UPI002412292A|nr:cysteine hydrolase [Rhizobium sp. YJ-22]MDG3576401.1 cysteine hydrolase [Rhizobium sp. YJ-22]